MDEKRQKISQRIKRYLKNLAKALFGLDPYEEEMTAAKEQLKKSAENIAALRSQLFSALERWEDALKDLDESEKRVSSLQVLTENLRGRIKGKDALISKMEAELNKK